MMANDKTKTKAVPIQPYWLVYLALLIAGLILVADAVDYHPMMKTTAKLGIALLYSALALFVGNGRSVGFVATGIIWVGVLVTWWV
mgnify:CR=1 FL=1